MELKLLIQNNKRRVIFVSVGLIFSLGFVMGRVSEDAKGLCGDATYLSTVAAGDVSQSSAEGTKVSIGNLGKCALRVDVRGAVISPGVYCLDDGGSAIEDAVEKAGGVNQETYAFKYVSQSMNFAQKIVDGGKVYVPFADDVVCEKKKLVENPAGEIEGSGESSTSVAETNASDQSKKDLQDTSYKNFSCISINNASKEELDTLTGVGQSIAQKIIDGRPYALVEDIKKVSGIGESLYAKIKDTICL